MVLVIIIIIINFCQKTRVAQKAEPANVLPTGTNNTKYKTMHTLLQSNTKSNNTKHNYKHSQKRKRLKATWKRLELVI